MSQASTPSPVPNQDTVQPSTHAHDAQVEPDTATHGEEKLVPVSEAIRYRRRAQAAEQQTQDLQRTIESMREQIAQLDQVATHLQRQQRIDELLRDSDVVDLDVARLLTQVAVESMDEPDLAAAVSDLRRSKPYLFRRRSTFNDSAMTARPADPSDATPTTEQLAREASATGNRRDLLAYLRRRRKH